MLRQAGSRWSRANARLGWLVLLTVALWAMAPGCSCEGKKPGQVGVPDAGDADVPDDDADVADPEDAEPDADADEPDVDEDEPDVDEDEPDADVEDEPDTDIEDEPDPDRFLGSCLFPVLDCLGQDPEAVSCTVNPLTGDTSVSYGTGRAARWERDDQNRYVFEAFFDGVRCYEAQALDEREEPFAWEISSRRMNYGVTRDGDQVTVTCPEGDEETYTLAEIGSWLPRILPGDQPPCLSVGPPRCEEDIDCQPFDDTFECCAVANTARCLVPNQCPSIPEDPPELESCLTPMLECFGNRHVPTACSINPNVRVTDINYTRDRRAVVTNDGFDNYTVETSQGRDLCYLARVAGEDREGWGRVDFVDPDTGAEFAVVFEDGQAQVTCADETTEVQDPEAILQYIPFFLDESEPLCEVSAIDECGDNNPCQEGLCCPTLEGNQCLDVEACPEVQDPWDTSCMRSLMECFGDNQALALCVDYGALDITEVAYVSGARATYFIDRDQQVRRTYFEQDPCFEAVQAFNPDGFEIRDMTNEDRYLVEFQGNNAVITCPGEAIETVPRGRVEAYLPSRPGVLQCNQPVREDVCSGNGDCAEGQECCNVGDRNLCLVEGTCDEAQPREACESESTCGDGETCCNIEAVRVCNPRLCGNGQICCDLPEATVCATEDVCNRVNACDQDNPDACEDGQLCCPTIDGTRCLDVSVCPDLQDPWSTSCMFATFECFGRDHTQEACFEDEGLDVVEVEFDSTARLVHYSSAGREGRRTSFGAQPCFNALEGPDGLEVEDLLTGERFAVDFNGLTAQITCPDNSVQQVPTSDVRDYLPERPAPGACEPRQGDDTCQTDAECAEGLSCCDIGDRHLCLTPDDCEQSQPRLVCDNDAQCGDGFVCCDSELVNVCDPGLCGDRLCCVVPEAQVCRTEADCNRVDECQLGQVDACPQPGEQCCETEGGTRCLNTDVCPDPADPIGTSCAALVLGCFGESNELAACQTSDVLGVTTATYLSGAEATFFQHRGQAAARTANGDGDCYQLIGDEGNGYELQDLLGDGNYQITVEGDGATISCPQDRSSVVPVVALRRFLPELPELELCEGLDRDDLCQVDGDCQGGLTCCDVGDRNLCLAVEDCELSVPRAACDADAQCGDGQICCTFARARTCDPIECDGDLCCDQLQVDVCALPQECAEQVFDECDTNDPDACVADGQICCDTLVGTRCQEPDGDQCPSPLAATCAFEPFECFGQNPELAQCVLRDEDGTIEAVYDNDGQIIFSEVNGQELRQVSRGGSDCYEALARPGGFDVLDLASGERFTVDVAGDRALVTCADAVVTPVPLALVQDYLPAAPQPEQCTSPETQWQESCLFSLFECSGADLTQLECVEYDGLIDRTEVSYLGGVEGVFFNRAGAPVLQTAADGLDCFEAVTVDGGYQVLDMLGGGGYEVALIDGLARITCPDQTVDTVDAAFVEAYLPQRPPQGVCDDAPRDDACQTNEECGDPQLVCCDLGPRNGCVTAETCFTNSPRPLCGGDEDCAEGQFCCARTPVGICDPDVCGDQLCCEVAEAQVCGTADECNGIFDLCQLDLDCGDGALCCETIEGARCIPGDQCPPPPDPMADSCLRPTLECFGRFAQLDACVDYGDIDRVEASYTNGGEAIYYTSFGRPARRTRSGGVLCYDAFETGGGGFEIVDGFDGAVFGVAVDGPQVVVTCADDTEERFPLEAFEAYMPERPLQGCADPERDDECGADADCQQLDPSLVCCDGGDRNICAPAGTCEANEAHVTCDTAEVCGDGQECCALGGVRICDPTVCGDEVCCNVIQAQVCGSNQACNTFEDVCAVGDAQSCPAGSLCCPTNVGTRCFDGVRNQAECPEVVDPWPGSCLFDVLECGGASPEFAQCVNLGDGRLSTSYDQGRLQVVYQTVDGAEVREVSAGGVDCYQATQVGAGEGGFNIEGLVDQQSYQVRFAGANTVITCPDATVVNVPRATIDAYFPTSPVVEQCQDPEAGWQGSCLFPLFECFGTENTEVDACVDYGELNLLSVDYTTGNAATFFTQGGVPVARTRDGNQQPCFRVEGTVDSGLSVVDLLTSETYQVDFDGDLARIQCPDASVDDVLRAQVVPYLPVAPDPNACDPFVRDDRCQADADCGGGDFVCCDLGDQNFCTTRETCERSRPRPTCDVDADCGVEGTICCDFGPLNICDGDQCGDAPCCSVNETKVCASEAECNGIFDLCDTLNPNSCEQGSLCCETGEGNRCLVGDQCPPPPDPLVGSCIFDLFQCFGRFQGLDACVDYGDLDMTEVDYTNGRRAVFYRHLGQEARIAGDELAFCFEALAQEGGLQIRDLGTADVYSIAVDGDVATITCPDATVEQTTIQAIDAYLPGRPAQNECQAPVRDDECQRDTECQDLDPALACCDVGDRNLCLTGDECRASQVRATCDQGADCDQGQECCPLLTTRVCNPSVCGVNQLCCNVPDASVCGSHAECNEIINICEVGNNATCPQGQQCCDSNVGARCVTDDGGECPVVEDLWPTSCLFETFECFGADAQLAACFEFGDGGPIEASYVGGGRARYFSEGGAATREVGRGQRDCFRAAELGDAPEGGFVIQDSETNENFSLVYVGGRAQITCPDQTVVNVSRATVEAYLPAQPDPLLCDSAEEQWRRSCLFGTFECFGADNEVATCADFTEIGIQQVGYANGATGQYFNTNGQAAFRTRNEQASCFQAHFAQDNNGGVDVQDLVTGERFGLTFDGDAVQITCPDNTVQTVLRSNVEAYLPTLPDPCAPAVRDDQCQADADCGDPQLICCDIGDANVCATREDCARSVPREACDGVGEEELAQGTCAPGSFCCEMAPVRICDPSRCGGELCCSLPDGAACGGQRECANIVDICSLDDPASCAPGSVCCPTENGTTCFIGEECPPRDNALLQSCMGATLSCFGLRDFESCELFDGAGRLDATYSLGGEVLYFGHNGADVLQAYSNGLACYTAQTHDDGQGYTITDASSGDVYDVRIDGANALVTCPDETVQFGLALDIEPFVPARPDPLTCQAGPRQDQCQDDAGCQDGTICCDAGDRNLCLTPADCFVATPRPTCELDVEGQCGDGALCCEIAGQRVCDPLICGPDQICCDTEEAAVCGTLEQCAGIFDECSVDLQAGCAQAETCCPTLDGARCVVGEVCPDLPDPVLESCLVGVFECAVAEVEVNACVDFGDLDRTEVTWNGGFTGVYYSHLGAEGLRTRRDGLPCYERLDKDGTITLTDLEQEGTYEIVIDGLSATVTCSDGSSEVLDTLALQRYLPERPAPETCQPAGRDDECQTDAQCQQIDGTLVCCDSGDRNVCVTREACAQEQVKVACATDDDCGQGTICCDLPTARLCEPSACGDDQQVCCTLEDPQVCATEDLCNGVIDRCVLGDDATCPDGAVCCPGGAGTECFVGQCPEAPDPVLETCVGSALNCFGRDVAFNSCVDWGELDRTEASYEGGSDLIFFARGVNEARRAYFNGVDCYEAIEVDGAFFVHDLLLDEIHEVSFAGGVATVTCDGGLLTAEVPEADMRAYLPARPDAGLCTDGVRDDECQGDGQCGDQSLICCDIGDRNQCLTPESCLRNAPQVFCQEDAECGDGNFCCEQTDVRVCDPLLCGQEQPCCTVPLATACGDERRCNGIVDLCVVGEPNACNQGETCCETGDGNRCLAGNECPPPPDPIADTCLAGTFACFGRDNAFDSCVDWNGNPDRTEVTYVGGSLGVFFNHRGAPGLRGSGDGGVACFNALEVEGGYEITEFASDENGPVELTHTIAINGPQAVITCADAQEFTVPASAVSAYLLERPAPNRCAAPVRDLQCNNDRDCGLGETCCDLGTGTSCLGIEACQLLTPRPVCEFINDEESDPSCAQGTVCCEMNSTRVCDPVVCGDEVCCDLETVGVCATEDACGGVVDTCVVGNPATCEQGSLCCDTELGTRCLIGEVCPEPPNPILDTCLVDAATCFGLGAALDACVDFGDLDRTEATYDNNSTALFFSDRQRRASSRVTDGLVTCYETVEIDGGFEVNLVLNQETHQVVFNGDEAVVTCSDAQEFILTRAQVEAAFPARPDGGQCEAPVRNDECAFDSECEDLDPTFECCDIGDQNICATREVCATNEPRQSCFEDANCGLGDVCCPLELARVCDPQICGDQICCTVEQAGVCATQAECNGRIDFCAGDGDCQGGESCCPTLEGSRCLVGDACPDLPDPLDGSCLQPTLLCFGREPTLAQCTEYEVGVIEASYDGDSAAVYYAHEGDAARRTSSAGGVPCYELIEGQGGSMTLTDLSNDDLFRVAINGDVATITCADNTTEQVPTLALLSYLPSAPDGCQPAVRNDQCQTNTQCQQLDPQLVCCDSGTQNECIPADACAQNSPRSTCDADPDCGQGEVCCALNPVRVCDASVCPAGEVCCSVEVAQVCATDAECGGVFDFCDPNVVDACADGSVCCPTEQGNRCLFGDECPAPPDPIITSCAGGTLLCFGANVEFSSCTESEGIELLEVVYAGDERAQYFTRFGRPARRTYLGPVPCYNATEDADGNLVVEDTLTQERFVFEAQGDTTQITCPDNSTQAVPTAALAAYFPEPPDPGLCQPAQRIDDCTIDSDCGFIDPNFVCCDTGTSNLCTDRASCRDIQPRPLCTADAECGDGVGCCEQPTSTVCDPILCNGQACCQVSNRQVCGGSPEGCVVGQSCLAETLQCFGEDHVLAQCFDYGTDVGVLQADYESGASAFYFDSAGKPARRTRFDVLPCFQAVEIAGGGYQILNLQNGQAFEVDYQGDVAQITCADNQQETVPVAAIEAFFPEPPALNQCAPADRDDECQVDNDCAGLGPNAVCCNSGTRNLCLDGVDCQDFAPKVTCSVEADCPAGTGCCELEAVRVCDPTVCGDDICCTVPAGQVCSDVCLLCNDDAQCSDGKICCDFTGACTAPEECVPPPGCAVDADCQAGEECCRAGQIAQCAPAGLCPDPCRDDSGCDNGRLCCGSQSSPFGAHCSTQGDCTDDVQQLDCVTNADCGGGQLCCRTLDAPACVAEADCPVACIDAADCGQGQECCLGDGRTPVCVATGTCTKGLGESCGDPSECSDGLTCCPYDQMGDVCVPADQCNNTVPALDCGQDPSVCDPFLLATCCEVGGAPQCSVRSSCDRPFFQCAQDTDCGASGFLCCENAVNSSCVAWQVGSCDGDINPF